MREGRRKERKKGRKKEISKSNNNNIFPYIVFLLEPWSCDHSIFWQSMVSQMSCMYVLHKATRKGGLTKKREGRQRRIDCCVPERAVNSLVCNVKDRISTTKRSKNKFYWMKRQFQIVFNVHHGSVVANTRSKICHNAEFFLVMVY